jgi:hypothetical protein
MTHSTKVREVAADTLTESELDKVSGGTTASGAIATWDHLLGQYGYPYTGDGSGFSAGMKNVLSGVCE